MRKRCVKLFLCVLLCVCMLLSTTGCGGGADPFEETNELVIYCPPYMTNRMESAVNTYKFNYPDVAVTFKTFGNVGDVQAYEEYKSLLQTELSAGKGPDIVIFSSEDFPDIYKVMDGGSFYNIDNFLATDSSFEKSDYNESVFDGGYYEGQRLFIPLDYYTYSVVTTEETLQAFDMSLPEQPTFSEWSEQIVSYISTHSPEENRKLLFCSWPSLAQVFLYHCGLKAVDNVSGQTYVQTEEFRKFMEFYKAVYANYDLHSEEMYKIYGDQYEVASAVKDNQLVFYIAWSYSSYMNAVVEELEKTSTVRVFPLPVLEGEKPIACGSYKAAINSGSPNKANAYEFLKILLSPAIQTQFWFPVHNDSMSLSVNKETGSHDFLHGQSDYVLHYLQDLAYDDGMADDVLKIVIDRMTPWFENQKSYDDCLTGLQSTLELYLYE